MEISFTELKEKEVINVFDGKKLGRIVDILFDCISGEVKGIVVHDYMAMYIEKLLDGTIPYEKMDYRIFRLIWEQKKAMLERIEKMEEMMPQVKDVSEKYKK